MEQPFRDRSNTLSEKPALPVIRDKYKDLTGEVEVSRLCVPRAPRDYQSMERVTLSWKWVVREAGTEEGLTLPLPATASQGKSPVPP